MFRNIVWERLICLGGLAAMITGWLALGDLPDLPYHDPNDMRNVFEFALWAGLAAVLIGGIGWFFSVRSSTATNRH